VVNKTFLADCEQLPA